MAMNGGRLVHGGDLELAESRFGRPDRGWLDLSTGINPIAYPLPALAPERWTRLPGSDAGLRAAAAQAYGVGDARLVVPAPGAQALIQLLPALRRDAAVAILVPTYEEHQAAWTALGHRVRAVETIDRAAEAEIVVLVNPNNPDGRLVPVDRLLQLADDLAKRGGLLVVDESFADTMPLASLAPHAGRPGLLVLRSFGKFFGLAGLRLGFALAEAGLAADLRRRLGPWAVNGPAMAIAEAALLDDHWIAATRMRLNADAKRLDTLLTAAGATVLGGTPLFRLCETAKAEALFDHLGRQGILVRTFPAFPRRLRFGLPGAEPQWRRLLDAFESWNKS
ncbi:MAG: threonine-phosphate decarboxylase [Rhodospirillales bacterium]|nr:threonine-phosphate decarboxylase [Rhodospirillales bacterium]